MLAAGPYLLAALGLAVLMIVHEGGHYLAARKFGMRVIRFSIATPGIAGIDALPGAVSATAHGSRVELRCKDSDAALRALLAARPDAYDIEVAGVALEDAFITITDGIAA